MGFPNALGNLEPSGRWGPDQGAGGCMVRFSPWEAAEASGRTLEARPLPRALGGALTQCPWVQPLHPTLWSATLTCFWFPRTWGL